jgi:uncharacterized membrane protein YhdT
MIFGNFFVSKSAKIINVLSFVLDDGAWKYFQIERHQRHKKTTATNNDKCRKIRDKKVQNFQNFSLSCLYLSKFVTVVSHCLSNFLLSFIFDCSFFPRLLDFPKPLNGMSGSTMYFRVSCTLSPTVLYILPHHFTMVSPLERQLNNVVRSIWTNEI